MEVMTERTSVGPPDATENRRLYQGVRTKRVFAFLIDIVILAVLTLFAAIVVFFLGIFTLGLGWLLYAVLWPAVALLYTAFTMGGPRTATPGMRAMGLEMRLLDGSRMTPMLAAVHVILFYASWTLLTPLVLLVSLFSSRKRLLHDMVIQSVAVNADAAREVLGERV